MAKWIAGFVLACVVVTAPRGLKAQPTYTLITSGTANYTVGQAKVSADGSKLFFVSNAQITPDDGDTGNDIYRVSSGGGTMTLISGSGSILPATFGCASPDGSKVIFETGENLPGTGDSDFATDVFLWANGTITQMTGNNIPASASSFRGASADCSKVFFETQEGIGPNDFGTNMDVYELNVATGAMTQLSGGTTNTPAFFDGASADGNTVFFRTMEQLTLSDGDTFFDVYRASGGAITLMTPGTQTAGYVGSSSDGSAMFFATADSLSAADVNGTLDIYRGNGVGATLISSGGAASAGASFLANSSDGSVVFFSTAEPIDPADVDTADDIYQSSNGVITLLTGSGSPSSSAVIFRRAATDGGSVIFISVEPIDPADTDTMLDVYEASTSGIRLLSPGTAANAHAQFNGASADCSVVFFDTIESLSPNDTNTTTDVYAATPDGLALVSGGFGGTFVGSTPDGTTAFFSTTAAIDPGDVDGGFDVYSTPVEVVADTDPPVVTVSVDAADVLAPSNWYNLASSGSNGVLVHVSANDTGGVTNLTATDGGAPVLNTASSSGSFSLGDGQHTINVSATDGMGNSGAGSGSTALPILIRVDQTAPTVTCTTPTILLHATGNVLIATVSDATSGPAGDVSIAVDTSTVGPKTAQATGSDVAGNQTTQTCAYQVTYQFTGFGAPVSSPPNQYVTASVAKNIPLTFSLGDGQGAPVLGLGLKAVIETDGPGGALCAGVSKTLAANDYPKGKSGLIDLGGGNYEYRFKAPKAETGQCRSVSLTFGDGVLHTVNFLLTP